MSSVTADNLPDANGHFGPYGGRFVPETLMHPLQELEEEEIVERTVIPRTPVRVEYALTRKGRDLASAIDAMAAWAERWVQPDAPSPGARPASRTRRSP